MAWGYRKTIKGAPSTLGRPGLETMTWIQVHQSCLVAPHARARTKSGAAEHGMLPLDPEHEHGIVVRVAQLCEYCGRKRCLLKE
jgi:hypothetical protein